MKQIFSLKFLALIFLIGIFPKITIGQKAFEAVYYVGKTQNIMLLPKNRTGS